MIGNKRKNSIKHKINDMKKLLMFMLLLMSLAVSAETGDSLMTVDWNSIKAEVRANPQRVQNLVDEFIKCRL